MLWAIDDVLVDCLLCVSVCVPMGSGLLLREVGREGIDSEDGRKEEVQLQKYIIEYMLVSQRCGNRMFNNNLHPCDPDYYLIVTRLRMRQM